jgi:trimeric autotransporter adhesin
MRTASFSLCAFVLLEACTSLDGLSGTGASPDAGPEPIAEAGQDGASVSDAYRDAVLADAPIAYFRFEDTSGAGARNEIAGSTVTCVLPAAGVTLGVEGISSSRKAVQTDAAGAQITVSGAMAFAGTQPFSVEMWVQVDAIAAQPLVLNMDGVNGTEVRTGTWLLMESSGALRYETWANGTHVFWGQAPGPLVAKRWAHLVYGYSDALGHDVLYVDAAPAKGGRVDATATRIAPSAPLSFGGASFTGRIDEVAIYDKALSAGRIAAHFAAR